MFSSASSCIARRCIQGFILDTLGSEGKDRLQRFASQAWVALQNLLFGPTRCQEAKDEIHCESSSPCHGLSRQNAGIRVDILPPVDEVVFHVCVVTSRSIVQILTRFHVDGAAPSDKPGGIRSRQYLRSAPANHDRYADTRIHVRPPSVVSSRYVGARVELRYGSANPTLTFKNCSSETSLGQFAGCPSACQCRAPSVDRQSRPSSASQPSLPTKLSVNPNASDAAGCVTAIGGLLIHVRPPFRVTYAATIARCRPGGFSCTGR